MNATYVLDACGLLAFLNDEPGVDLVDRLLQQARNQECVLYMHKLNLLEIYYGVFREVSPEKAEEVLSTILALPIAIVAAISDEVLKTAGRLKAVYKISLADSLALAEAKTRNVPLVTTDHHEFDPFDAQHEVRFYWLR